MKKLFKNTTLFFLPVLLVLILIPVTERDKYIGLESDCFNHAIWLYDRITNNEKPIDIAFIGSSHTINAIDDQLIETELIGFNKTAVNFGYCRLGRNLHENYLKLILSFKQPEYIILEIREDENLSSHPVFPHLANTKNVFLTNYLFNKDLIKDIYTHLMYKTEILQDNIFFPHSETCFQTEEYGFASSPDTIAPNELDYLLERIANKPKKNKDFGRNFNLTYPRIYIRKMVKICNERNIQIIFLYLPSFGSYYSDIKEIETYKKFGDVLLPPECLLKNKDYWHDVNHLNQTGAKELSLWVKMQLESFIQKTE